MDVPSINYVLTEVRHNHFYKIFTNTHYLVDQLLTIMSPLAANSVNLCVEPRSGKRGVFRIK